MRANCSMKLSRNLVFPGWASIVSKNFSRTTFSSLTKEYFSLFFGVGLSEPTPTLVSRMLVLMLPQVAGKGTNQSGF